MTCPGAAEKRRTALSHRLRRFSPPAGVAPAAAAKAGRGARVIEARQLIAVPKDSNVKSLKDLVGKKIGVVTASSGDDTASREFGKTNPDIRRFENTPTVISELANGGVDAAIGDNGVIAFRVQEHKNLKTVDDPSFPKEYFGIVVKQGNKALQDKLNTGLAAVKADGTYAQVYKKWFQSDAPALPAQ